MSVFLSAPWKMKSKEFDGYIPVTESNKKEAIINGRCLYVIEVYGSVITYRGFINMRPRLVKCRLSITGHPHLKDSSLYISEDEDLDQYKKSFVTLFDKLIKEKTLYIKLTDPITKYTRV
jgi:hypothetical protein